MRTFFFAANFAGATFLWIVMATGIFVGYYGNDPHAFVSGVFGLPVFLAIAWLEWLAFYRNRRALERPLGGCYAALSCLLAMGALSTFLERTPWPKGFATFVASLTGIAGYMAACGLYRIRRRPNAAVHPIAPAADDA